MDQLSAGLEVSGDGSQVRGLMEAALIAAPDDTVASIIDRLRSEYRTPPGWIAVVDQRRLAGLVDTAALLTAEPGAAIGTLARAPASSVPAAFSAEQAAWLAARAGTGVIAVEDRDGSFLGLVTAARLLPALVHEHEVDLARIGGFLRGTSRARTASEEPVARRVLHRAPWLLLGLLGAVVAARIVREFEVELEETVALAFFLPGIVYMADAVGTQTETLVIRGLSVGVPIRRILRLEVLTGAVMGVLLSVAIFPLTLAITGDADLSLAVALSLLASSACATLVAMTLPWLMDSLDLDPAFGSGPLATVIQDLLSIVIYFGIALALVS